jgi:Ion channel
MLPEFLIAFGLLALCVVIHASGLAFLMQKSHTQISQSRTASLITIRLLVRISSWLLLLHLIEIAIWGLCYYYLGCLPDLETAFYFSGTSYATIGYGDIILPREWRMLGPVEGLTGILLCGLSTSFFFVVVTRTYRLVHSLENKENRDDS